MRPLTRLTVLVILLLSLPGCAGLKEYKWVEDNTLYSSNFPSIEIQVSPHLKMGRDYTGIGTAGDEDNNSQTNLRTKEYVFWNKEGTQQFSIRIDNLTETKWFFYDFNFSANSAFFTVGEEEINGYRLDTAIYVHNMPQQAFLVKIYGRIFGTQTKLRLFYMERVDNSWTQPGLVLNAQQQAFLKEFDQRARESFTINPFSNPTPPEGK